MDTKLFKIKICARNFYFKQIFAHLWLSPEMGGARGTGTPKRNGEKEINVTTIEVIQELYKKKRKLDFIL